MKLAFSINIPNATTLAAMQEATDRKHLKKTSLEQPCLSYINSRLYPKQLLRRLGYAGPAA